MRNRHCKTGDYIPNQFMVAFTVAFLVAVHGGAVEYLTLNRSGFRVRFNLHRVGKLAPSVSHDHLASNPKAEQEPLYRKMA